MTASRRFIVTADAPAYKPPASSYAMAMRKGQAEHYACERRSALLPNSFGSSAIVVIESWSAAPVAGRLCYRVVMVSCGR